MPEKNKSDLLPLLNEERGKVSHEYTTTERAFVKVAGLFIHLQMH